MDFITGNKFKGLADLVIDQHTKTVNLDKDIEIVFVKTDDLYLNAFFEKVLPELKNPVKLITHNSDCPITHKHKPMLDNPMITAWYGMNCHITHPKLHPIPIGIANEEWPHGNTEAIQSVMDKIIDKNGLVYCNYDISTNYSERLKTQQEVGKLPFVTMDFVKKPFVEYLERMATYKYVISPEGNSVDCHRIWEAVYIGVIPIIKIHQAHRDWSDIPALYIRDWSDLCKERLEQVYTSLLNRGNKTKSYFEYYKQKITFGGPK